MHNNAMMISRAEIERLQCAFQANLRARKYVGKVRMWMYVGETLFNYYTAPGTYGEQSHAS